MEGGNVMSATKGEESFGEKRSRVRRDVLCLPQTQLDAPPLPQQVVGLETILMFGWWVGGWVW